MKRWIAICAAAVALGVTMPGGRAAALCVGPGETPPELTAQTLDGERVSLKDYQGKVVFLAFWASWCSRCPEEIAFLKKLSARFSDDLVVLAVNQEGEELTDTQPDHLRAAMVETQIPFPVLLDPNLETWRAYCLNALPTNVILDREGKVRFAKASFYWASEEKITQALEGLGVLRPTASSSPEG